MVGMTWMTPGLGVTGTGLEVPGLMLGIGGLRLGATGPTVGVTGLGGGAGAGRRGTALWTGGAGGGVGAGAVVAAGLTTKPPGCPHPPGGPGTLPLTFWFTPPRVPNSTPGTPGARNV